MNTKLISVAVLSLFASYAMAQSPTFDSEIDSEIDQLSSTRGNQGPQVATGTPAAASISPNGSVNGGQPIYILNQATPTSNSQVASSQVQKQPQVDILAAPLQKSRAEAIRDARQQAEIETENKIVEKLEVSRMEDEKRRASVLFGEPFNQLSQQQTNNIQAQNVNMNAQQAAQPVAAVVAPTAVQQVEGDNTRDIIREELRAALTAEQDAPAAPVEQRYFGAVIGMGDYPDVRNVKGNYVLGATFGTQYDDTYAVEGSFLYGDYNVEPVGVGGTYDMYGQYIPAKVDVKQYSGQIAMKYLFMTGMVKPVLGGLVQYSYRTYNWSQNNASQYGSMVVGNNQEATSHAVDVGIVTGADIQFTKKMSLGLDFRYMYNLNSRINANNNASFLTGSSQYGTPLEKLQYYTMSLTGRVNF